MEWPLPSDDPVFPRSGQLGHSQAFQTMGGSVEWPGVEGESIAEAPSSESGSAPCVIADVSSAPDTYGKEILPELKTAENKSNEPLSALGDNSFPSYSF